MKKGHLAYRPDMHETILCVENSDEDIVIHCGQTMTVYLPGDGWKAARYEMDVDGHPYLVIGREKFYSPAKIKAII